MDERQQVATFVPARQLVDELIARRGEAIERPAQIRHDQAQVV